MALKPNFYETLYVVRPDLKEEELKKIQTKLDEFLGAHAGEIMKSGKWAERDLAYEIQNHTRGVYYILVYKALPTIIRDIEKHLRFYNTDVLRFMTVKIKEEAAMRAKFSEAEKAQEVKAETPEAEAPKEEPTQAEAPPEETPTEEAAQPETSEAEAPKEEPTEAETPQAEAPQEEIIPDTDAEEEGGKE